MNNNTEIVSRVRARLQILLFLFAALIAATPAGAQPSTPVGVWLHDNQRIEIQIAPCGENLCGRLVWLKSPNDTLGQPLVDLKNPNSALRTRPLLGLTVLDGLRRTGENSWGDGSIYDPDDGATYDASVSMQDDGSLQVHAFVFTPMLGKTFLWTRVRMIARVSESAL